MNNAGSPVTGTFEEVELEDWRADLDVKLFAAIYCIRAALPFLKQSDQARIININSIVGKQSTPEYIANSVDRAACLSFNKVLSDNLAKYGILVNSVNPGNVKSEAWGQHARLLCARLRAGGLVPSRSPAPHRCDAWRKHARSPPWSLFWPVNGRAI